MEHGNLIVSSSPHIRSKESINSIMYNVIIALLPATAAAIYFFRLRAFLLIAVSIIAAIATEVIIMKIRKKPITISDGSAIITGLLLALTISPAMPLWMAVVGAVVSISIGKQVYGGLGGNPFNPALVGRAFLIITFPVQMTTWISPVDGLASATPLGLLKMEGIGTGYLDLLLGNVGGSLGETSAILLLIGGLYLIYKGVIRWYIPTAYLGTVAVMSLIFGSDPIFQLLSGGLMLGAFFMATDMVTTPVTKIGQLIFGFGAGLITIIVRLYGGYPEGVLFSILLMNIFTPIIDKYTMPKIYGEVKSK